MSQSVLNLGNTIVRQLDGLYSLNDLHKAAGGEEKDQPAKFMRLDQTQALVAEIEQSPEMESAAKSINGGPKRGTYVCRELVYAYANWISPAFYLKMIRFFDAMHAPQTESARIPAKPPIKTRDDLSFTRRDSKGRLINWSVENDHNELWGEAAKIGQGFMDEIAELASHDEVAAYWAVLFAISGQEFKRGPSTHFTNLGWGREFGFAEAIARAVIDGLRARGNSNYEPFDPDAPKKKGGKKSLPRAKGSAALPPPSLPSAKLSIALH